MFLVKALHKFAHRPIFNFAITFQFFVIRHIHMTPNTFFVFHSTKQCDTQTSCQNTTWFTYNRLRQVLLLDIAITVFEIHFVAGRFVRYVGRFSLFSLITNLRTAGYLLKIFLYYTILFIFWAKAE